MERYRVAPARPVCLTGPAGGGTAGRRSGGAEIGVFTAERYFSAADVVRCDVVVSGDRDHEPPLPPPPPPMTVAEAAPDVASQSGRTAASSEASWNSRSALLSGGQYQYSAAARLRGSDFPHGFRGRKPGHGQRWTLFGRNCPCAGRKAVTDVASEPRSPMDARFSAQSAIDECLQSTVYKVKDLSPPRTAGKELAKVKVTVTPGSRTFPLPADNVFPVAAAPNQGNPAPFPAFRADVGRRVLSPGGFTFPTVLGPIDEPPRASLEVFRPIEEDAVMLADPPPALPVADRGEALLRAPPPVDDEAMSDASSDLFDLESFAASSSYPTTSRRRGSRRNSGEDDLPCPYAVAEPALSECMYPPSEASVVWSVATADGGAFDAASMANFSSAASACCVDEFRYAVPDESPAGFTAAMSRNAGRKKGGGFLDSCRCEKAVSVGPTPVRVVRPPAYPGEAAKTADGAAPARCHPSRVHVPVRT